MIRNKVKPGDWLAQCDRCDETLYASYLRKTWDNLRVCKPCWESRHPLDKEGEVDYSDNPSVPWTRPDSNANTSTTSVDGSAIETDNLADTIDDADKTLRVDGTPRMNSIQHWNTALTANRTITLDTTDAVYGDSFTIQRTAGGAFTLDVGGLKTIPASVNAVVVVTYIGGWTLSSYTTIGL